MLVYHIFTTIQTKWQNHCFLYVLDGRLASNSPSWVSFLFESIMSENGLVTKFKLVILIFLCLVTDVPFVFCQKSTNLHTWTWRHIGEWIYRSTFFLTLALVRGEWLASCPCHFIPGERVPGTHWVGGWVDPRADLDNMEKWTFLTLAGLELWTLGRPASSQLLYWLRYAAVQMLTKWNSINFKSICSARQVYVILNYNKKKVITHNKNKRKGS
jgi:hypothetical protein